MDAGATPAPPMVDNRPDASELQDESGLTPSPSIGTITFYSLLQPNLLPMLRVLLQMAILCMLIHLPVLICERITDFTSRSFCRLL